MANFNPGSRRIRTSALSSKVVVGYARFAWRLDRGERAAAPASYTLLGGAEDVILLLYACAKNVAANLTPKQLSQLAKLVKEEFG
jgi:hypothetical protein